MTSSPVSTAPRCQHDALHFDAGGMFLVCDACNQAWRAVMQNRVVTEYSSRFWSLSAKDRRVNPSPR